MASPLQPSDLAAVQSAVDAQLGVGKSPVTDVSAPTAPGKAPFVRIRIDAITTHEIDYVDPDGKPRSAADIQAIADALARKAKP